MKYEIVFKVVWDKSGKNIVLPKELTPILEGKEIKLRFFNKEK